MHCHHPLRLDQATHKPGIGSEKGTAFGRSKRQSIDGLLWASLLLSVILGIDRRVLPIQNEVTL
jgi:hypothetical protein